MSASECDLGAAQHSGAEQAALEHERRVGATEVAQRLGRDDGVAVDERDGDRALEHRNELGKAGGFDGEARERVLEHLVLGARRPQRAAQLRELGDRQTAVLGEHRRVGLVELRTNLVDDRCLLWSGHSLLRTTNGAPQTATPHDLRSVTWSGGFPLPPPSCGGDRRSTATIQL